MEIKMSRRHFDALSDEALGHACFEPMVCVYQGQVRQLRDQDIQAFKAAFFQTLSQGQRALFIFYVFYDHGLKSSFELYGMAQNLMETSAFSALKRAAIFFGDEPMGAYLAQLEGRLLPRGVDLTQRSPVENADMQQDYETFKALAPHTNARIGASIRDNPLGFIQWEG